MFAWRMMAALRPEDGGGAGASDPAPAGGGDAAAAAAASAAGAADPYWRDFLPPDIRADTPEERFDRLSSAWKAQRDQIARQPAPPKAAADYAFTPSEKIAGYFKGADDPIMTLAREAALTTGIPKDAFGPFVGKLYEAAQEKGLLAAPYDAQAEGQKIAERIAPGLPWAEAKPKVLAAVDEVTSFAGVLGDQLKLGDGAKAILASLTDDAAGVELLQSLSGALGKDPAFHAGTGAAAAGTWTKDSLDAAVRDPRYNPYDRAYDKSYREKVDAGFRQVYGS